MQALLSEIPNEFRARFNEITTLISDFCDRFLNDEYNELCTKMTADLCFEDSIIARGKAAGWAAGVVYSVGWVNFLTDPASMPHVTASQIADGFGVSESTMMVRSRDIRTQLQLGPMDPHWTLPGLLDENPMVWMLEVDGIIVDIRMMPRELQIAAYEQGLIPYVPADRD